MKLSTLPLLSCPAGGPGRACGGTPLPAGSGPLPSRTDYAGEELLEGELECGRCGVRFPTLGGVAVLVPDPAAYLRRYRECLRRDLGRYGLLSSAATAWLEALPADGGAEEYGADFRYSQQFEAVPEVARFLWSSRPELAGPFGSWLEQAGRESPGTVLRDWARELRPNAGLGLDMGCGGGGLAHLLAPGCRAVIGIDRSLLAVLLARRALLHVPEADRTYRLRRRCGQEVERPIPVARRENLEFIVADALAPPFPAGCFDLVCSSNLIDIAGLQESLAAAARCLAEDGVLLLTDPFQFPDADAPPGDPVTALRQTLAELDLAVIRERDGVPWVWTTYDRHWRIYLNYCAAARRPNAAP